MVTKKRVNIDSCYQWHESTNGFICFYCGHDASTIDHCPPISLVKFYSHHQKIIVKACESCNYHLGARFLPTLLSRVQKLVSYYQKKYAKILNMPKWTTHEINKMTGTLKQFIIIERDKKVFAQKRIAFLKNREKELLSNVS